MPEYFFLNVGEMDLRRGTSVALAGSTLGAGTVMMVVVVIAVLVVVVVVMTSGARDCIMIGGSSMFGMRSRARADDTRPGSVGVDGRRGRSRGQCRCRGRRCGCRRIHDDDSGARRRRSCGRVRFWFWIRLGLGFGRGLAGRAIALARLGRLQW